MPQIVDTTIRLLSQEPLAGKLPTGEVLRIAEILDTAGFAYLEVSGGGVSTRPSGSPSRARGSASARSTRARRRRSASRCAAASSPARGPSRADIVRRFVSCAADNGIDIFRLHDPLNDVVEPARGGRGDPRRGQGVPRRPRLQRRPRGRDRRARRAREAAARSSARRASSSTIRPTRSCRTSPRSSSQRIGEDDGPARRPLRPGRRRDGAPERGRGDARRRRPDRHRDLPAGADAAPRLRRVARRRAPRPRPRDRRRHRRRSGRPATSSTSTSATSPSHRVAPRIAVRAAEYDLPAGLVAALDVHLRAHAAGDRLLDTLDRGGAHPGRVRLAAARLADRPDPRLAGAAQRPLRAPLRDGARRVPACWSRVATARRRRRSRSPSRARVALVTGSGGGLDEDPPSAEDVREAAEGLAASEEDLVLLAMFGEEAEPLLQSIRAAPLARDVAARRRRRRRRGPSASASSSRSCRSPASARSRSRTRACASRSGGPTRPAPLPRRSRRSAERRRGRAAGRRGRATMRVESPMVGVFYRASVARARRRSSRSATSSASARRCACSRR